MLNFFVFSKCSSALQYGIWLRGYYTYWHVIKLCVAGLSKLQENSGYSGGEGKNFCLSTPKYVWAIHGSQLAKIKGNLPFSTPQKCTGTHSLPQVGQSSIEVIDCLYRFPLGLGREH